MQFSHWRMVHMTQNPQGVCVCPRGGQILSSMPGTAGMENSICRYYVPCSWSSCTVALFFSLGWKRSQVLFLLFLPSPSALVEALYKHLHLCLSSYLCSKVCKLLLNSQRLYCYACISVLYWIEGHVPLQKNQANKQASKQHLIKWLGKKWGDSKWVLPLNKIWDDRKTGLDNKIPHMYLPSETIEKPKYQQ